MSSTLTTTGRLADDFWFLAHGDASGRPRLAMDVMGLALAGALLAELLLVEGIEIHDELVIVTGAEGPADDLSRHVLDLMWRELGALPVRSWLDYLGPQAPGLVAKRLYDERLIWRERSRLPLRSPHWVPGSDQIAALPAVRVTSQLMRKSPLDPPTAMLAALARATGLRHPLLWEISHVIRAGLDARLTQLSPPLRDLLGHVEAALGRAATVRV